MEDNVLCNFLKSFLLPEWDKLPDIGLYLDQVLLYIEKAVPTLPDTPPLTRSMINNYVKLQLMDPPVKKKYGKNALAQLLMIRELKQVSSIETMKKLLHPGTGMTTQEIYTEFLETQNQCIEHTPLQATPLQFALKSAANHVLCSMTMLQDDRTRIAECTRPK